MFVKVFAVFCQIISGANVCDKVTVADSTLDDTVTMQSCMIGEAYVVKFMQEHPIFRSEKYRLDRWACQIGNKPDPHYGAGKA